MISKNDQFIIDYLAGEHALEPSSSSIKFSYICNPDKTIRWLFPESLKSPMFLNFYSTSSWRSRVLKFIIKSAYFFRLSTLISSGTLKINIQQGSRLAHILSKYKHNGFSIFTGTIGVNRKAIVELHQDKEVQVFVKIALTEPAEILIKNEAKCLGYLKNFKFNRLVIPDLLCCNEQGVIGLSNIKPYIYIQSYSLMNLHIEALSELYTKSIKKVKWANLYNLHDSKVKVTDLLQDFKIINNLDKSRVQELATKILLLIDILEERNEELTVAISHGDFTPWNMYHSKNILYLFDWELSEFDMPLLIDAFHYVFQSSILIKKVSYKDLILKLKESLKLTDSKKMIEKYNIDVNLNYQFYLVYTVSYYLKKYTLQEELHEQVFWLIDVWEEAIKNAIETKGKVLNI